MRTGTDTMPAVVGENRDTICIRSVHGYVFENRVYLRRSLVYTCISCRLSRAVNPYRPVTRHISSIIVVPTYGGRHSYTSILCEPPLHTAIYFHDPGVRRVRIVVLLLFLRRLDVIYLVVVMMFAHGDVIKIIATRAIFSLSSSSPPPP